MLGLGSSLTSGSDPIGGLPSLSFTSNPALFLTANDVADSGDINPGAESADTSFDLRLQLNTNDFDEATDSALDFTLTDVTVTNNTTGVTQTLASSVTMDNVVDFAGAGLIFFFTDAGGPLDDIDLSSDSGEEAAHNGVGDNSYSFNANVTRVGFSGSVAVTTKTVQLTDD
jgi:hypothetical protein